MFGDYGGVYLVFIISCSVMVSVFVLMCVVYLVLLNAICFLSLGVCLCILLVWLVDVMDVGLLYDF